MGYNVQVATDSKHGLIANYEVSNNASDMGQMSGLAMETKEILGLDKLTSMSDQGYLSATDIAKCLMNGVIPKVCNADMSICIPCAPEGAQMPESQKKGQCVYLEDRNIAICPMGQILMPARYDNSGRRGMYHNYQACKICECKCTGEKYQKFGIAMTPDQFGRPTNINDLYIKQVRIKTDKEVVLERLKLCEYPFGIVKEAMGTRTCLTKGKQKVSGEFALTFLAYNMKRVINILGLPELLARLRQSNPRVALAFFISVLTRYRQFRDGFGTI